MTIEQIPLTDIKPYERNAKQHPPSQVRAIAASLKAFGFQQPLVVDKDNVLIVGHGRFLGAKEAGFTSAPCIRALDLTPEQIAAYRLADNKLNESKWDRALVLDELRALDAAGFDVTLTGFSRDLILDPDGGGASRRVEGDAERAGRRLDPGCASPPCRRCEKHA